MKLKLIFSVYKYFILNSKLPSLSMIFLVLLEASA